MKPLTLVLLWQFSVLPGLLCAADPPFPKFDPTPVSEGPLLAFKQPKKNSDELALYLFDPTIHDKPHLLWQDRYHPNPRNLKRLSAKKMMFEFQDQLQVVDLPSGVVKPLLPGKEQNKLVTIESEAVYFFKRLIPRTRKDLGISLTSRKNDKTVVEKYFRPRDVLFRYDLNAKGDSKKVSPIAIEHLLEVTDEGFLVITAGQAQKVARIDRDGNLTEICPFDSQWVAKMTTHAISPKGNYLALAVLGLEQDFHEERTLIVCDLKKNKVCFSDPDVPLGPSFFSGRSNYLELIWQTDEILRYGGPFTHMGLTDTKPRFANVARQERFDKETETQSPETGLGEEHEREQRGLFELKFGEVYFSGEQDPIASVLDERGIGVRDLAVDAKGNWGAYSESKDDQVYLIDGNKRSKKAIHPGWVHDLKWLETENAK